MMTGGDPIHLIHGQSKKKIREGTGSVCPRGNLPSSLPEWDFYLVGPPAGSGQGGAKADGYYRGSTGEGLRGARQY